MPSCREVQGSMAPTCFNFFNVVGDLEFIAPRGMVASTYNPALRMRVEDCLGAGFSTTCVVQSGTFLMFPSWLMHSVKRYEGTRPRISIAFNFGA